MSMGCAVLTASKGIVAYSSIFLGGWFFCNVSYLYFDSTIHPNCWMSTVEKVAQVALNQFVLLIGIFPLVMLVKALLTGAMVALATLPWT